MPGDKKPIENDYNPKPGDMQQGQNGQQGAKTDPHQPMDKKLPNGKLPHPADMQQGQMGNRVQKRIHISLWTTKKMMRNSTPGEMENRHPQMTCSRDTMAYKGQKLTNTSQLMQHRTRSQWPHHHPQVMDLVSLH